MDSWKDILCPAGHNVSISTKHWTGSEFNRAYYISFWTKSIDSSWRRATLSDISPLSLSYACVSTELWRRRRRSGYATVSTCLSASRVIPERYIWIFINFYGTKQTKSLIISLIICLMDNDNDVVSDVKMLNCQCVKKTLHSFQQLYTRKGKLKIEWLTVHTFRWDFPNGKKQKVNNFWE